jgi:hypothetical protein
VKSFSTTQFTCETGENEDPSTDTTYFGSKGLKRKYYESNSGLSFDDLQTLTPTKTMPLTTLELPRNVRNTYSGNSIEGYFRAPKTANYRFYMACDD